MTSRSYSRLVQSRLVRPVHVQPDQTPHLSRPPCPHAPSTHYRPSITRSPSRLHDHSQAFISGKRWSSSAAFQHIHVSKHELPHNRGTYATVKLGNPKKLNVINSHTLTELKSAFDSLQYDENLRVMILTSEKTDQGTPAFCAGADIREMSQMASSQQARAFITQVNDVCEVVRNMPAIAIAAIDGLCFGAGMEMAAACDFRLATRRSLFAMPEVEIGIPSVVHARSLVNIMGWQEAKKFMYFATRLDGDTARKTSLVDELADTPEELESIIQRYLTTLTSYGRKGMHAQKRLFKAWEEVDFQAGLRTSIDAFADSYADGGVEPQAFMNAWIEKQKRRKT